MRIIFLISLSTFLLTVTESRVILLICLIALALWAFFHHTYRRSYIISLCLMIVISWRALMMLASHHTPTAMTNNPIDTTVMEVMTIQTVQQQKYIVSDQHDNQRILRFGPWYIPPYDEGTEIFVTWWRQRARPDARLTPSGQITSLLSWWLSYEFNYPTRQMMKGYHGIIYAQQSVDVWSSPSLLHTIRNTLRHMTQQHITNNDHAGLFLGMLIGDTSLMSPTQSDTFQQANLIHIVAVSGGNIILVVTFVSFLLFWLPVYVRYVVLIGVIICYSLLAGMDSSVVRAMIMGILSLIALIGGREVDIRRLLWLSRIAMLLYNPYFLPYDIGFLFSFGAIIGLIWMQHRWTRFVSSTKRHPHKRSVWFFVQQILSLYLLPTIGASLWVLPFLLFFIGEFNILWFLSNLFVLPLIGIVTIGWVLVTVTWWFTSLYSLLMEYIFLIAQLTQQRWIYILFKSQRAQRSILFFASLLWSIWVIQHQKFDKNKEKDYNNHIL